LKTVEKVKRQNGKIVLGDGEVTGHQHTIRERSAKFLKLDAETFKLELPRVALLRHEKGDTPAEHRDIRLPVGEPCITYKRQYSPDGWSRVVD
jgi:hypothetical protein